MQITDYSLWEKVTRLVTVLPEVHEQLCHGTPAFYSGKKFFVRLKEDGQTIALYNNERDEWIAANPEVFFFTEHYQHYPIILVDLQRVTTKDLKALLINSWRIRTSKKRSKSFDS